MPCGDCAMSKNYDWLSNDFVHCDWLNRCLRFRTVTVTPYCRFPTHTKTTLYNNCGLLCKKVSFHYCTNRATGCSTFCWNIKIILKWNLDLFPIIRSILLIVLSIGHQTCLKISNEVLSIVKEYPWQCSSCKTCENCYLRRPKVIYNEISIIIII